MLLSASSSAPSLRVAIPQAFALRPPPVRPHKRGVLRGVLALLPRLPIQRGGRRGDPELQGGQRAELRPLGPLARLLAQARHRRGHARCRRRRHHATGPVAVAPAPLVPSACRGVRACRFHRGAHHHVRLLGHCEVLLED
eukprot:5630620-Pleurochrysis_carterae.AAC.1